MTALSRIGRGLMAFVLIFAVLTSLSGDLAAAAAPNLAPDDGTYQMLPFSQSWTNTGLITVDDDWSGVSGIIGFRGDALTATTGVDPQTVLVDDTPGVVDVIANQTNPNTLLTGGVAEFEITDPVVAFQGSGTADAPYLLIHLNTTGYQSINVTYNLRDIDGSADNAVQAVALHFRVGTTGSFTNVPSAFVADATTGPSQATLVTPVSVTLPASVDNQSQVQLRIMTTNAVGSDEWVGIDDISITGTPSTTDLPPTVTDTTPDNGASNVPVDTPVDVTFSEPVVISGTVAIDCTSSGVQNVTPTGGPATFDLPHTDFDNSETCTVTILADQVTDQDGDPNTMAANYVWSFDVTSGCFTGDTTPIHDIQGSGLASPLLGQQHTVEALVIADFQGVGNINGFFIQEPDGEQDADPATAEGLFVYDPANLTSVAVDDYVRVSGTVSEFQNQTQLSSLTAVTICQNDPVVATPVTVTLPFPDTAYPERFEGMSVVMTQTLTVNETFNLGRGGILTLANGRLQQPTNVVLPGAPANALQAANNLNWITLDDGSLWQNPDPIIYPTPLGLSALNTVRSGDSVSAIAGVFTQGNPGWTSPGILYRIHPFSAPTFTATNPRPAAPNPVRAGGSLKVSSFNVLNYFLTLDDGINDICGPDQNAECRGADSVLEFTRQRDKLLQALYILNADVVGLMELENTPNVEPLADLVNGLNALAGAPMYDYIATGTIVPGDVIKVGLIYKPGVVQPVGDFAILNSTVDPTFDTSLHRPALAQSFQEGASGGRFTVIVNHLKSKGCTGATGANADLGDGQSCWNLARTEAANALINWALSDPTGTGDPDFLIVGDLNSYAREDPIRALETGGYTNLETLFVGPGAYSYVFASQSGSLDHSMANASLTPQVSGATTWHINADEPSVLDYNTEFKSVGQVASLYNADAYRTSDHDPLLIGMNLTPAQASIVLTKTVGTDPLTCATTASITAPAGTNVTYCYTVVNTGNLTLNVHDLADSELGNLLTGLSYALAPGASAFITETTPINVTTVNTATWTAYNVGPIDVVTATATATVTVPPPNIFVDPLSVSSSQQTNTQTQHTLTISNTGGALLSWEILEEPVGVSAPAVQQPLTRFDSQAAMADEMEGFDDAVPAVWPQRDPVAAARAQRALLATGILLIPDWTADRVMAFDAITGDLLDANFIPSDGANLSSPKNAILSASGDSILVSDQIDDVVQEYALDGSYIGVFAPAGGANTAILDNITGIDLRSNGNLLVSVQGGANGDSVAEFDTNGNYLGNFIANGSGGLDGPFDVYPRAADWLVPSINTDQVLRYDLVGAFIASLAPINSFPQQVAEAANSNVLVANFTGTQEGIVELTPAGSVVGIYDPATVGGYRGAYELPNGNILTTNGTGVYEIDRSGNLVETKISTVNAQYIEYVAIADCSNPADIPWASASPITGTTAAGSATDVTVTLDSTGLLPGLYNGNLCILSNDPDAGPGNETDLVIVPLTLVVEEPTAVTLSDIGAAQAPLPLAGLPLAALPAAVGLALGAAYALRRRR